MALKSLRLFLFALALCTACGTQSSQPMKTDVAVNAGMYQVQLVDFNHAWARVGTLTINRQANNGNVSVVLQKAAPSTLLHVTFCRWATLYQDCLEIGTASTDASGNANSQMNFGRSGTWAGTFFLTSDPWSFTGPSTVSYSVEPSAFTGNFAVGQNYRVALFPQDAIASGKAWTAPTNGDPLKSGSITISGQTLHAEVIGALGSTQYSLQFCPINGFISDCNSYLNGSFTTDSSGQGSIDVLVPAAASEVFFLTSSSGSGGFMTAFRVD